MSFRENIVLTLLWFVAFWFAPAFLVNWEINVKTRDAEQILLGHRAYWFHHDRKIYGCIAEHQRLYCDTKDRYSTDDTILGWAKGNHIP